MTPSSSEHRSGSTWSHERMTGRRGLTLLEVMVALMILGLVGLSYLQLFHQSHRVVGDSRQWSQAVEYAEDAMERAKLEGASTEPRAEDLLPGGFRRQVTTQAWRPGLVLVEVTVSLPGNARFELRRLLQTEPPLARGTALETSDE
jgi:prepilin-type N-terminal cleavage/methylation domain-containing protein